VTTAILEPRIEGAPELRRGKVRHLFDLGEQLLLVASDRISAFDCILPTGIPGKGRLLTQLSRHWFSVLESARPHHFVTAEPGAMPEAIRSSVAALDGRGMLTQTLEVVPFECIVRGYLAGSGWKEYQRSGTLHGKLLPAGLRLGDRLPEPLFTPSTKAESGHDEPISFEAMSEQLAPGLGAALRERSLAIFREASAWCEARGLILCDTKFEFGLKPGGDGTPILADEVLTPDSSRFFKASEHRPGEAVKPFDKQHVRDYLLGLDWDRNPPAPPLPEEVVLETLRRYEEITRLLTE